MRAKCHRANFPRVHLQNKIFTENKVSFAKEKKSANFHGNLISGVSNITVIKLSMSFRLILLSVMSLKRIYEFYALHRNSFLRIYCANRNLPVYLQISVACTRKITIRIAKEYIYISHDIIIRITTIRHRIISLRNQ